MGPNVSAKVSAPSRPFLLPPSLAAFQRVLASNVGGKEGGGVVTALLRGSAAEQRQSRTPRRTQQPKTLNTPEESTYYNLIHVSPPARRRALRLLPPLFQPAIDRSFSGNQSPSASKLPAAPPVRLSLMFGNFSKQSLAGKWLLLQHVVYSLEERSSATS